MNCSETALDVLTRAATLVETDAKISLASRLKCEDLKRTSSAPVSPVDLRDSPSKELPTRSHKLRRSQLRRDLAARKVGATLDRTNHILNQPLIGSRDESSASDMDQQSDDDPLDDDLDDDEDEEIVDDAEEEEEEEDVDNYPQPRTEHVVPDEDDGPLDMTTGNRSRSCGASSPSPSPPLVFTPSFCSNPPLLYSPFASAAPPPPYHPMPPLHYQPIRATAAQRHHQHSHRQRSPSPPPPPYFASSAIKSNGAALSNGKSNGAATLLQQQHRPSVITCAPALAGRHRVAPVVNRRSLSDPTPTPARSSAVASPAKGRRGSDLRHGHRREILSGMCDPVIDEHFRRSLGKDYPEYLAASSSSFSTASSTPATSTTASSSASISITGMSVDDHFAKALGDTWLQLQGKMAQPSTSCSPNSASASPPSSPVATGSAKASSPPPSPLEQQRTSGLVST